MNESLLYLSTLEPCLGERPHSSKALTQVQHANWTAMSSGHFHDTTQAMWTHVYLLLWWYFILWYYLIS